MTDIDTSGQDLTWEYKDINTGVHAIDQATADQWVEREHEVRRRLVGSWSNYRPVSPEKAKPEPERPDKGASAEQQFVLFPRCPERIWVDTKDRGALTQCLLKQGHDGDHRHYGVSWGADKVLKYEKSALGAIAAGGLISGRSSAAREQAEQVRADLEAHTVARVEQMVDVHACKATDKGMQCTLFDGHPGQHFNLKARHGWDAKAVPPCNARTLYYDKSMCACSLTAGHPGYHRDKHLKLSWPTAPSVSPGW